MTRLNHDQFLKLLYELKDREVSAKEDWLQCLEDQKKSKVLWRICQSKVKEHRQKGYHKI